MARPETEPKTALAERLRAIRRHNGDLDRDLFADRVGVSKNTLAYYERGERTPDAAVLERYREAWNVDLNWLITGEGSMSLTPDYPLPEPVQNFLDSTRRKEARKGKPQQLAEIDDLDQLGMISIPRYDEVRPSAGPGSVATSDIPNTRVAFERHWLAEIGVQTAAAVILPAQDDSMEPTIMNGSPMLVDTSKTEVQNGYIYVIAVENDLLVKRVRRRLDGRIDLISDNLAYGPETLDSTSLQHLRVIGRVYAAVSKF